MKRITLFLMIVLLGATTGVNAMMSSMDRQERMAQVLDCLSSQQQPTPAVLHWADVCVTNPDDQMPSVDQRGSSIDAALSAAKAADPTLTPGDLNSAVVPSDAALPEGATRSKPRTTYEIMPEVFAYKYEEPNFMELEGNMIGISGNMEHRFFENQPIRHWQDTFRNGNGINVFKLDTRFAYGSLDYTSENSGSLDGEDNYVFEIRGLVGYDIPFGQNTQLTPFFGLGYRYLFDEGTGMLTTTNNWGYDRESNYTYLPLGISANKKSASGWRLGFDLEYDILLRGLQRSHIGDGGIYNAYYQGYPDVENDQESGYGLRASVKLSKEWRKFNFVVQPFVRYWSIEDSEYEIIVHNSVAMGWHEPENETTEVGIQFGVNF